MGDDKDDDDDVRRMGMTGDGCDDDGMMMNDGYSSKW